MDAHVPDTWEGFGLHLMRTRPQGVPVEQIADDVTLFLMHVHDRQEKAGRGDKLATNERRHHEQAPRRRGAPG